MEIITFSLKYCAKFLIFPMPQFPYLQQNKKYNL